jgi:hypothetical protein
MLGETEAKLARDRRKKPLSLGLSGESEMRSEGDAAQKTEA